MTGAPPMIDLVVYAVPFFVITVIAEAIAYKIAAHDHVGDDPHASGRYELKDTATNIAVGVGHLAIITAWKGVIVFALAGLYTLAPYKMNPSHVWPFVVLFFLDDFAYYWYHRTHHEIRLLWANHVVHHSSRRFNLSTALRETWAPMTGAPFWLPIALLGFPPWMIFMQFSINLVYQFWIHTERIGRMPAWYEAFFNTPSHHRVHHGSNHQYRDRNYGAILIIWDRLFQTYEPEREKVIYGLAKNINSHNPVYVAFHEYGAIASDMKSARSWRERLGYVFRRPGWSPDGENVVRPRRRFQSAI